MNVKVTIVGEHRSESVTWPQDWQPPHLGDEVMLGNDASVYVNTVVWYPMGDPSDGGPADPFVYVVLGAARP